MDLQNFLSTLMQNGYYRTQRPTHLSRCDRLLGRYDAWYYLKLFRLFLIARLAVAKGKFNSRLWQEKAYEVLQLVEKCGGQIEICGYEHVCSVKQPVVYVANHISTLETLILPGLLMTPIHGVVVILKASLLRYPVFGPIVSSINPIVVGRKRAMSDYNETINAGILALRTGSAVLVFPEATRRREFAPRCFNTLGVKLAIHAQTQLVPVALRTDFHGLGKVLKDIGTIHRDQTVRFKFGPPLTVTGNGRQAHTASIMFIKQALLEWGFPVKE